MKKRLWFSVIVLFIVFLFIGVFSAGYLSREHSIPPATAQAPSNIKVYDLWVGANKERTSRGVPALSLNPQLNKSASDKCAHMAKYDYWAHTAPDGTEPWVFFKKYLARAEATGENLAYGQDTHKKVIDGWMQSEGHKKNLLNSGFTNVGYAVCDFRGTKLTVQHLVRI